MRRKSDALARTLLYLLLLISSLTGYSQPQEIKNAIAFAAKITSSSGSDATSILLQELNFTVPPNLRATWNQFSAYRKIETAYWAADRCGNGDLFIATIVRKLERQFESVHSEKSFEKFKSIPSNGRLTFASISSLELPPLDHVGSEIKNSLTTITKYTDAKALGGTLGILKYHFNLNEDDAVGILRESTSDFDALLRGVSKASIPPSQKERVKNIAVELLKNFEAAHMDRDLYQILEEPQMIMHKPGKPLSVNSEKQKLKRDYADFLERNYPTNSSRMFRKMLTNPEGFGGIILGNSFSVAPDMQELLQVRWIPEKMHKSLCRTGSLEFVFKDGIVKTMRGVLWEDIYAAYNICYLSNDSNHPGEALGIGLAGASYPQTYDGDHVFDSLIKSRNLSVNQLTYYRARCEIKRKVNELTEEVESNQIKLNFHFVDSVLTNTNHKIKEWKNQLSGQESLLAKRRAFVDIYVQELKRREEEYRAAPTKELYRIYTRFYNNYKTAYMDLRDLEKTYQKSRATFDSTYFAEYDSTCVSVRKDTMLNTDLQRQLKKQFSIDFIAQGPFYEQMSARLSQLEKMDSVSAALVDDYIARTNKAILHPAIANLELGRCLLRADVMPRTGLAIVKMLKERNATEEQLAQSQKWLSGCDTSGWKFSDDSLFITSANSIIEVRRFNSSINQGRISGLLNFNLVSSNKRDTVPHFVPVFPNVLPVLTKLFYDYYRLNSIANVVTVIRWAKQSQATFLNIPKVPPQVKAPGYLTISPIGEATFIDL